MEYVNDPQFGQIINYERLRKGIPAVMDQVYPEFNLLGTTYASTEQFEDDPNYMTAMAASGLAYMMLVAAEEHELAEQLKYKIFTLGWTEEHCGTDLLSIRTQATPMSDDPNERHYHIKGAKWLINNSYHADYHMVLAKVDPTQDGPRSMSIFVVPHSSTRNWERLNTHVLTKMVLTKYEIDGPGILVGKVGHGLSILQRMAMPSKYQCSYMGVGMLRDAIPAAIEHLSTKRIFGDNPIKFSNVYRQMYTLTLQSAFLQFVWFRALAYSDSSFLQFHGTMLKSWMLLRTNEVLSQNLLVTGSKGFLAESVIGRSAIDSFVYPVFDGHYTLNTLMSAKMSKRYLTAIRKESLPERINFLRQHLYKAVPGRHITNKSTEIRHPDFFDYADYISQFNLPFPLDGALIIRAMNQLIGEIDALGWGGEAEYKYKIGTLLHWVESVLAACEMWKVLEDDHYLNVIIMQYNGLVNAFNNVVIEGALQTAFLQPLRQLPIPVVEDPRQFFYDLLNIQAKIPQAVLD